MSYEFLAPDRTREHDGARPVARSPLERLLERAGARFDVLDGWSVAADFGSPRAEVEAGRSSVAIGDRSQLGKLELQSAPGTIAEMIAGATGGARLRPGLGLRAQAAWWCPLTPERVIILTEPGSTPGMRERVEDIAAGANTTTVLEVTSAFCAIAVIGPRARDLFARLTALDLRQAEMPEGGFRPGSVARVPGMILRERGDSFLLMCGAAHAEYMWTAVTDAGKPLGAVFAGAAALERLAREEVEHHS